MSKDLLEDGDWHTVDELKEVSQFPERWLEELRRDGLEVVEDGPEGQSRTRRSARLSQPLRQSFLREDGIYA